MVHLKIPVDEKVEELLESLQDHMAEMKEEITELRRGGQDTSIIDILIMDVIPKIKFARATGDERDIASVKKLLGRIRYEIDQVKDGTEFDEVLNKIESACEKIRQEKYHDALKDYARIQELYGKLDPELKRVIYLISIKIHKDIEDWKLEVEKEKQRYAQS